MDRDVYAVLDDVHQEKLTLDHVRREYGVVIDAGTVRGIDAENQSAIPVVSLRPVYPYSCTRVEPFTLQW